MQVDSNEIIFIREKAPKGFIRTVANNTGVDYQRVRTELYALKKEYDDAIVNECRRLLKAMTGLVYNPNEVAA